MHQIIVIGEYQACELCETELLIGYFVSAPIRCGNAASILEISPGGRRFFNVFDAAPENERDGPNQAEAQAQKVNETDR